MDGYRERYDALSRSHIKALEHLEESRNHVALLRGAAIEFLEAFIAEYDVSSEHLRCEMAGTIPAPNWPERHTAACMRLAAAETALRAAIGHGEATPQALVEWHPDEADMLAEDDRYEACQMGEE